MTKRFLMLGIVALSFFIMITSCNNDDDTTLFNPISNIATFHGNLNSNNVIIHVQGGPDVVLRDDVIKDRISISNTKSALHINVHQVQTLNKEMFSNSEITFQQTPAFHTQNISNLKKVIDYFREQNKNIYIVGVSFGGFLIQELISTYGIDIADGYAIMVARLNIEEETWTAFSQGIYKRYFYDNQGNFTIKNEIPFEGFNEVLRKNMAILASGLGQYRYTEKLSSIQDLSKVTYFYGNRDGSVGPLSAEELTFLNSRGANVVLDENGNHTTPVTIGMQKLKELFNIQ